MVGSMEMAEGRAGLKVSLRFLILLSIIMSSVRILAFWPAVLARFPATLTAPRTSSHKEGWPALLMVLAVAATVAVGFNQGFKKTPLFEGRMVAIGRVERSVCGQLGGSS